MGSGVQINLEGKSEIVIGIYELEVASQSLRHVCTRCLFFVCHAPNNEWLIALL